MHHEQAQHQMQTPVAVVASAAEAELVATTLRVSGIEATFTLASVIPSLEWAEGHAISVPDERLSEAIELLRGLGHEPLAVGEARAHGDDADPGGPADG